MLSLILICFRRPIQLEKTLESISSQTTQPDELILMEDGDDGGITATLAKKFKAKHIQSPRPEELSYGNMSKVRNIAWRFAQGDVIGIQGSELIYESKNAIEELVKNLQPDSITTPCVKNLDKNGNLSFPPWYTHPSIGSFFGDGPHFLHKKTLEKIGGWEEQFIGYGFDDGFFDLCCQKQNIKRIRLDNIIAAHQWHERGEHEIISFATRSLFCLLESEINEGLRPPVANSGSFVTKSNSQSELNQKLMSSARELYSRCQSNIKWRTEYRVWHDCIRFMDWATLPFLDKTFDLIGQIRNQTEDFTKDHLAGYLLLDSAWAFGRALQIQRDQDIRWLSHKDRCFNIHMAWAAKAVERANKFCHWQTE